MSFFICLFSPSHELAGLYIFLFLCFLTSLFCPSIRIFTNSDLTYFSHSRVFVLFPYFFPLWCIFPWFWIFYLIYISFELNLIFIYFFVIYLFTFLFINFSLTRYFRVFSPTPIKIITYVFRLFFFFSETFFLNECI